MRKQTQAKKRRQQHHQHKKQRGRADAPGASKPHPPVPLLLLDRQEAELDLIERFDGMAGLRHALSKIGQRDDEWAGVPMPMGGCPMTIEPTYPKADELMRISHAPPTDAPDAPLKIRNTFWSWKWRCQVCVFEVNGKIMHALHQENALLLQLQTLYASDAWGIRQEKAAIDTLGELLRHRQFKQYLLTGMFLETSKRSGVHYLFRRLRPTVAFTEKPRTAAAKFHRAVDGMRILCALCMHPIGYYDDSWAGAMTPTDDVLAHLMLMRGDEHLFWRRCNQHSPWMKQAGIL